MQIFTYMPLLCVALISKGLRDKEFSFFFSVFNILIFMVHFTSLKFNPNRISDDHNLGLVQQIFVTFNFIKKWATELTGQH